MLENPLFIAESPRKMIEYAEAYPIDVEYDYERYIYCPHCNKRVTGAYWKRPREVVLTSRKVPDFLYACCDEAPFVISKDALDKIQAAGLKGILVAEEIEKVRFQRKSKYETPIPRYYHIELAYSRITIDHLKSKIIYGEPGGSYRFCPLCRGVPRTYNFFRYLELNMEGYEGYDIFHMYEMGGHVLFSKRFIDFYMESGLKGLCFVPAQKHFQWAAAYFLDGDEDA